MAVAGSAVLVWAACGTSDAPGLANTGSSSPARVLCERNVGQLVSCGLTAPTGCVAELTAGCIEEYASSRVYSPAAVDAMNACPDEFADCSCFQQRCSDASVAAQGSWAKCVAAHLAAAPKTAVAQRLHDDFCAACPDGHSKVNPTSCTGFFAGPEGGPGFGTTFEAFADSVLQVVDLQCTGAALATHDGGPSGDCFAAFMGCYGSVMLATARAARPGLDASTAACGDGGLSFDAGLKLQSAFLGQLTERLQRNFANARD